MIVTRRRFATLMGFLATGLPLRGRLAAGQAMAAAAADDSLAGSVREAVSRGSNRLELKAGKYGPQTLNGFHLDGFEIVGSEGTIMDMLMINDSSGIRFSKIIFEGRRSERGSGQGLVYVNKSASRIGFDDCDFRTSPDISSWGPTDWTTAPYERGLLARGPFVTVKNCRFYNLRNCLTFLDSDDCSVENSTFTDFGNDGIEFGGNRIRIVGNRISGSRHTPVESQHSDGIQGFPSPKGDFYSDIEISNNDVEFVGPGDYMQGISIFDGRWRNIRIINNRVAVNMWNAIAIYGVEGILLEKNTVISKDLRRGSWIEVRASKDGFKSSGVVARANKSPRFKLPPGSKMERNL